MGPRRAELAAPKLAKPIHIFRFDGTLEQATEIAELEKQEQKQPDADRVHVPNGTIDNDDQELKK